MSDPAPALMDLSVDNVAGIGLAALTVLVLGLAATALLLGAAYVVRRVRGVPSPVSERDNRQNGRHPDSLLLIGAAVVLAGIAVAAWGLCRR